MKIGFIDYYLDEWHANNYPTWIKEASNGEVEVAYAYGMIENPKTGMTSKQWCEKYGVMYCKTIEELTRLSDGIIVLSPDNCEMHEELSEIPLASGKPTYIDKTFAPDLATAKRIFKMADNGNTPCYSTSALRYAEEYQSLDISDISAVSLLGPGDIETYSIHQIEPLVMLVNSNPVKVMVNKSDGWHCITVCFDDGRCATATQFISFENGIPFSATICKKSENLSFGIVSDFFMLFIEQLVDFFKTEVVKVPHSETLKVMAVHDAAITAYKNPGEWITVEN